MRARGEPHRSDTLCIHLEIAGVGPDPPHGRLDVQDLSRKPVLRSEAVLRRHGDVAAPGEVGQQLAVLFPPAFPPRPAVDHEDRREGADPGGLGDVEPELGPRGAGVEKVVRGGDFGWLGRSGRRGKQEEEGSPARKRRGVTEVLISFSLVELWRKHPLRGEGPLLRVACRFQATDFRPGRLASGAAGEWTSF